MAYRVSITPRAERDLTDIFSGIQAAQSDAALRWYLGLSESVLPLQNQPARWPPTPEARRVRHLLYGKKPHIYRVIFRIKERQQCVEILHIRHGTMDRCSGDEVF